MCWGKGDMRKPENCIDGGFLCSKVWYILLNECHFFFFNIKRNKEPIKMLTTSIKYRHYNCVVLANPVQYDNKKVDLSKSCLKLCYYFLKIVWQSLTSLFQSLIFLQIYRKLIDKKIVYLFDFIKFLNVHRVQHIHDRWLNARQSFTGRLLPRLSGVRMPVQQTTVRRETRTVLETRVHDADPKFQQLYEAIRWCKDRLVSRPYSNTLRSSYMF